MVVDCRIRLVPTLDGLLKDSRTYLIDFRNQMKMKKRKLNPRRITFGDQKSLKANLSIF